MTEIKTRTDIENLASKLICCNMQLTSLLKRKNGQHMTVNTCDHNLQESDEMQLCIANNGTSAFVDLSKEEAIALRDKINEWVEDTSCRGCIYDKADDRICVFCKQGSKYVSNLRNYKG